MILVSGSLAFDQIMDFPGKFSDHILPGKIHLLNVSFLVHNMRKGYGGTAGNIAYTLSLLGVKCTVLGAVGGDFGSYNEFLVKNEVETKYIKTINSLFTSSAFGITDQEDNQIWGFYTGADSLSEHMSINEVKEKIDFGVIAPHNPRTMIKFADEYQSRRISYLFDPGMQLPHLSASDLKLAFEGAKIIIGNDYEVQLMQKKAGIEDLHNLAREDKIIITTLGKHGSQITEKNGKVNIQPASVRRVDDPAGAGDAYRAGFIAGYLRGFSTLICGRMASVSAAYTVEKYGTTTHTFTLEKFAQRYKENYGEEIKL